MKTEMRRITGRRNERGAEAKEKRAEERTRRFRRRRRENKRHSRTTLTTHPKLLPWRAYLMFRVRGEELQRADGEPELVRVRELPDAHAEGNQLVARDARRAFHDILADVIHALRVRRRGKKKRGSMKVRARDVRANLH